MRHLITGGAGFIGSHLAEYLLTHGHEVVVLDDLSSGHRENLAALEHNSSFELVVGSSLDVSLLSRYVPKVDVVHHLAASVGNFLLARHPATVLENNLGCLSAVLRVAAVARRKVLFASSSEVYGDLNGRAFRESDPISLPSPTDTRWAYSYSKAAGESLALAFASEYHLPVVILRLFNTIGPRQSGRYGHVVPRMVSQAVAGQPITVFGDGRQTRCFAWVGDVVEAASTLAADPRADGQIFNVGTDQEISMLELAERIRRLAKSSSTIQFVPYIEAYEREFIDVRRRVPDISKLERFLGKRLQIETDAALAAIIEAHRRAVASKERASSGRLCPRQHGP